MNVLTAAWMGAGSPPPADGEWGVCARCATTGVLTPVRRVVSKVFTGYDDWARPSASGVCPACAWGYTEPQLRATTHLVTRDPAAARAFNRQDVQQLLTGGALPSDVALVVPLRPGRKHLMPAATWGRVCLDNSQIPWTADDAGRLAVVVRLRSEGFGSRMLAAPSPPFAVLRRTPQERWAPVMADWQSLEPWRTPASPWLALALHATLTTPKEN